MAVSYGRKDVFLYPIAIEEHPFLMAARAEIAGLAREREQIIEPAFGTVNARESVVRIAAFQEAIDDALLEQALQAPLAAQLPHVAIGALVERAGARVAWPIHPAFGPPPRRIWLAAA